jgi:hypothetical protein
MGFYGVEDVVGDAVYATLFIELFHVAGLEILQKTAESDDMNQFMGDHIQGERGEFNLGVQRENVQDGMILNADFVEVVCA